MTTTLVCSPLQFTTGKLQGGQSATTLALRELTGTQDAWGKYVEFVKGAAATCSFSLPAGLSPDTLVALELRTNYRGPALSEMRWVWEAWRPSISAWVPIGDNTFAKSWRWSAASIALPGSPGDFVSAGRVLVRYRPLSMYDASDLDEWVLVATAAGGADGGMDSGAGADAEAGLDGAGGADGADGAADAAVDARDSGSDARDSGGSDVSAGADAGPYGTWWKPTAGISWDWQLAVPISHANQAAVYDIDMFNNSATEVAALHAEGRKVICYIDFGSWEQGRPDAGSFPASVLGTTYSGFPDERWLDIRRLDVLGPIMRARLDLAQQKGCDAVEPDNMDGYDTTAHESSGFPLSYADQITYNRWVAAEVHARGMAVGLKNDIHQTTELVADVDFAVSEQCFQYGECQFFTVFIAANKPVFECEYKWTLSQFCPQANQMNFSSIRKKNALDAYREACR